MNRFEDRFSKLRERHEGALITYFPIGEPDYDTIELAEAYIDNGVDLLEIGLPVVDPYYDGEIVSRSMRRITDLGRDIDWIFNEIHRLRKAYPDIPMQVFSYMQIFDQKEIKEFAECCREVDVDAMLIADATEEQTRDLERVFNPDIYQLRFMPFRCNDSDIELIKEYAKGYLFLQAAEGTTGVRNSVDRSLEKNINRLHSKIPDVSICPGFGISTPEHCKQMMELGADGVIVGSRIVRAIEMQSLQETGKLIRKLKDNLSLY